MPSPFPGMDPYLESPAVFPSLHDALAVGLMEALQPRLPEPYFAQTREHVWLEAADHGDVPAPMVENRELSLEICSLSDQGFRLVTVIEILSPSNKAPGSPRHEEYLQKQRELLTSSFHLVEIDLRRGGAHTSAVPRAQALKAAGTFDYHASVHRFDRPHEILLYPIRLEDVLPEIDIPLLPADGSLPIDLQSVFNRAYDGGPFRRRVRYGVDEIVPPLAPRQVAWVEKVLAERAASP